MIPQNVPLIDIHVARERARLDDVDGAIELARTVFDEYLRSGDFMWLAWYGDSCGVTAATWF